MPWPASATFGSPHGHWPAGLRQRLFRGRPDDSLPLRIEHRRIYILPTRRGWAFLLALLIMLVASINYALSLGYALSFLLTGLFSATLLHTYRNLAGIGIERVEGSDCFAGDDAVFTVHLRNDSRLDRHGLLVTSRARDRGPAPGGGVAPVAADVASGGSIPVAINIPAGTRGLLSIGRLTLGSDFPLGLWSTWCYVHAARDVTVYPAPESDPPPLPGHVDPRTAAGHTRAAPGDVAGLRAYQPGDPLSAVAWKSVARGQGLHVRQFDATAVSEHLTLDFAAAGVGDDELRLSRLCAWVLEADRLGAGFALQLPGLSLPRAQGKAARQAALEALARYGHPAEPGRGTRA